MFNLFKKKEIEAPKVEEQEDETFLSYDVDIPNTKGAERYNKIISKSFLKDLPTPNGTMDGSTANIKLNLGFSGVNSKQLDFYAKQSFIGYQSCSIIAQNWLVNKALNIPPKDAIRKGYELTFDEGENIPLDIQKAIRFKDYDYKIDNKLVEFVSMGRQFGIRLALFVVESSDLKYYEKPFNIDGVKAGKYKGISMVDPYWTSPLLEGTAVTDPSSMDFYEPTYWTINGKKYHKSHLIIFKGDEVADILKPSYFYGGLSLPQKIMSRVYSSETVADEAPLLAQTKRTNVFKTDLNLIKLDKGAFADKMEKQTLLQDNYGKFVVGLNDEVQQLDTALSDLDAIIMTQYQIVAGIVNIPISKLLGTPLKGFSSGIMEQDNYYEELENIQRYDMTPLLQRHYQLLLKSEYDIKPTFTINWNSLKILTQKEQAEIRQIDSITDTNYINTGVLDNETVLEKIVSNPDSGYNGIDLEEVRLRAEEQAQLLEEYENEQNSFNEI